MQTPTEQLPLHRLQHHNEPLTIPNQILHGKEMRDVLHQTAHAVIEQLQPTETTRTQVTLGHLKAVLNYSAPLALRVHDSNGTKVPFIHALSEPKRLESLAHRLHQHTPDLLTIPDGLGQAQQLMRRVLDIPHLSHLHEDSVEPLLTLCHEAILNPSLRTELFIGIGGTQDALNARVPAYLISALHFIKAFQECKGAVAIPTLRVCSAHPISSVVNDLEHQHTASKWQELQQFMKHYIATVHPHCLPHVRFDEAAPELLHTRTALTIQQQLERIATQEQHPAHDTIHRIRERGRIHGGETGASEALRYTSVHSVVPMDMLLGDDLVPLLRSRNMELFPDVVVSFGGEKEIAYNNIRSLVQKEIPAMYHPKSVKCITSMGSTPVYYTHREQGVVRDAMLSDIEHFSLAEIKSRLRLKNQHPVAKDLAAILEDIKKSPLVTSTDPHTQLEDAERIYSEILRNVPRT